MSSSCLSAFHMFVGAFSHSAIRSVCDSRASAAWSTLDALIDGWCERRALKPLGYLLRKYPGLLAHTDQQFELLDALKDVKVLCYHELTPDERRLVTKAHDFREERLNTRVI